MRARNIKPSLFKNEILGTADPLYTIVFEGLWCLADREGRLEDRPLRIHAEVNPYRPGASTVLALDWLVQAGFIERYEAEGVKCIQVLNFEKHQQPHVREAPSKLPAKQKQQVTEGTAKVVPSPEKVVPSTGRAPLIPDSPFLIPDTPIQGKSACVDPRETEPPGFLEQVQSAYPEGLHRGDHWTLAHKAIFALTDSGVSRQAILDSARAYRAQQVACGTIGTSKVLRPNNFYGSDAWRGPFQLPEAPKKPHTPPPDPRSVREQLAKLLPTFSGSDAQLAAQVPGATLTDVRFAKERA